MPSKEGPTDDDRFLIELLSSRPPLSAEQAEAVKAWWNERGQAGESLSHFLERQKVFRGGAERTVKAMRTGYLSFSDASLLFSDDGLAIIRGLCAEATEPSTSFDLPFHSRPEPIVEEFSDSAAYLDSPPSLVEEAAGGEDTSIDGRLDHTRVEHQLPPEIERLRAEKARKAAAGPLAGEVIGAYRLVRRLGAWSGGETYLAQDVVRDLQVVVRLVDDDRTAAAGYSPEEVVAGGLALARAKPAGWLRVLSAGESDGWLYVAREYFQATALRDVLAHHGPLDPTEALSIVAEIVTPVAEAQKQNLVHGNLHPGNIWLAAGWMSETSTSEERVQLSDPSPAARSVARDPLLRLQIDTRGLTALLVELLSGREVRLPLSQLAADSHEAPLALESLPPACAELVTDLWKPPQAGGPEDWDQVRHAMLATIDLAREPTSWLSPDDGLDGASDFLADASELESQSPSQPTNADAWDVGMTLGRCFLTERIGTGGSCVVFRALHRTLNIPVAVKILRCPPGAEHDAVTQQFIAEARQLARLNHPNVIRVRDFEDQVAPLYLVMEHVDGLTLGELIQQSGRVQAHRVVDIALQAISGLNAAWQFGLVHHDVSPSNILLSKDGVVRVADLGLAAVRSSDNPWTGNSSGTNLGGRLAADSGRLNIPPGTPAYMAPEQAESRQSAIDFRSDIYSLGCTLYHALTGHVPFNGRTSMEVILQHLNEHPSDPSETSPDIPRAISAVVMRMMAKSPEDRFESYESLARSLQLAAGAQAPLADAERPGGWLSLFGRKRRPPQG